MSLPASVDHRPVGVVAIHRDVQTTAARRDRVIEITSTIYFCQMVFQLSHIFQRRCRSHVATIKQSVDPDFFDALLFRLSQHRQQDINVRVNISVGQQAQKMKGRVIRQATGQLIPCFALINGSRGDGVFHQQRTLVEYSAGPDRIVANLTVAHIVIRRHADRFAVSLQLSPNRVLLQPIQMRRACLGDHVPRVACSNSDAIHDHQYNRTFRPRKRSMFFERFHKIFVGLNVRKFQPDKVARSPQSPQCRERLQIKSTGR